MCGDVVVCEGAGCGPLHDVCGELVKNALLKTPDEIH
jgi:hypothetical protein